MCASEDVGEETPVATLYTKRHRVRSIKLFFTPYFVLTVIYSGTQYNKILGTGKFCLLYQMFC